MPSWYGDINVNIWVDIRFILLWNIKTLFHFKRQNKGHEKLCSLDIEFYLKYKQGLNTDANTGIQSM